MKKSLSPMIVGALLMGALIGCSTHDSRPPIVIAPEPYSQVLEYNDGGKVAALAAIETQLNTAPSCQYPQLEKLLLQSLRDPHATPVSKVALCRLLQRVASNASLETLQAMLGDEKLELPARHVLETLATSQSDAVLRKAAEKLTGKPLVGVITSLGLRRDNAAVGLLCRRARETDPILSDAALNSLGQIATPASVAALEELSAQSPDWAKRTAEIRLVAAERLLGDGEKKAAGKLLASLMSQGGSTAMGARVLELGLLSDKELADRIPALLSEPASRDAALELVRRTARPGLRELLVGNLVTFTPQVQLALLPALMERSELPLHGPLLAIRTRSSDLQVAVDNALQLFGEPSDVPMLLDAAQKEDATGIAAQRALALMGRPGVADAIHAALIGGNPAHRPLLFKLIGLRSDPLSSPALLTLAGSDDLSVAREALRLLERLGRPEELSALLTMMQEKPALRGAALAAAKSVSLRADEKDLCSSMVIKQLESAKPENRPNLMQVLAAVGNPEALTWIRKGIASSDETFRDTSIRALAEWSSADAAGDLLVLAKEATLPAHRILSLRGYVRLAEMLTGEPRLAIYREAWQLAQRVEEKKLILSGLGASKNLAAIKQIKPSMADVAVQSEASMALLQLAGDLVKDKPSEVRALLKELQANPNLSAEAKRQLAHVQGRLR